MSEEVKDLQKGITEILVAIGKIETEIKQLSSMSTKWDETNTKVIQIEQSVKSAHHRIDELQKDVKELQDAREKDQREAKADRKWLWGAILGALGFLWGVYKSIQGGGV